MKTLLFLTGCLLGILLTGYFQKETTYYPLDPSKEACFILEMVSKDEFLQKYILSPTERVRTKEARKQFEEKKFQK